MSELRISVKIGPSDPALGVQFAQQGVEVNPDDCDNWESIRSAINTLETNGYLCKCDKDRMFRALFLEVLRRVNNSKEESK